MAFAPLPLTAPAPKENPGTPAKIELGRALFFDPVLSAIGNIACATCHQPQLGWTDGKTVAAGFAPLARNTPTILNVGFNTDGVMFWDNREHGLESQARHPIRSREEMRGDACAERAAMKMAVERVANAADYPRRFQQAFGEPVSEQNLLKALAAFERSLVTADTAFDRFLRGKPKALTAQQRRGMEAFTTAGCQHCHGGPMLSDFKLHVIGAQGERRAFRTPSLRNLRHTAPFMHNGSLRTLDEVLNFYDQLMDEVSETLEGGDTAAQPPLDPLLRHLDVRPENFADLKAFLESLSADRYDQRTPG